MELGIHVSSSGELSGAIKRATFFEAEAFQIFTSNPRGWNFNVRSQTQISKFILDKESSGIKSIFGHSIYLVNLASSNNFIYTSSINSIISGMVLAQKAQFKGVVTHIGSAGNQKREDCYPRTLNALDQILKVSGDAVPLLLETDSGSGNHLGSNFREIGELVRKIGSKSLGVCLDTAHIFEAGYDIRDQSGIDKMLSLFDKHIGLEKLKLIHLNDSKTELGSNSDRHEIIGKGKIGLEGFEILINHPQLKELTGITETPDGKDQSKNEIESLKILKALRHHA